MKRFLFYSMLAVSTLGMTACSQDETVGTENKENYNAEYGKIRFNVTSETGNNMKGTALRSITDIDKNYRPSKVYPLDYLYVQTMNPVTEPTRDMINHKVEIEYKDKQINKQTLVDKKYNLTYTIKNELTVHNEEYSLGGTIYFSQGEGSAEIPVELSVFKLTDIANERIPLNQFGFGSGSSKLRGTSILLKSYDPMNVGSPEQFQNEEGLTGRWVSLPSLNGCEWLKGRYASQRNLVTECKDEYFNSPEYLVAADMNNIYLYRIVSVENEKGGFYKVKTVSRADNASTTTMDAGKITMHRMTSIVNVSFMFSPSEGEQSYYIKDNYVATLHRFKQQYGVDLSSLSCPHAVIDGVNTRFFINESKSADKYTRLGRLVLWSVSNTSSEQNETGMPVTSMFADAPFGPNMLHEGYGMQGKCYSIVFPGGQEDMANQQISFWITVSGVNIKVKAAIPESSPIAFLRNSVHEVMVYIPARDFANIVRNPLRSVDMEAYRTLELPANCVEVK